MQSQTAAASMTASWQASTGALAAGSSAAQHSTHLFLSATAAHAAPILFVCCPGLQMAIAASRASFVVSHSRCACLLMLPQGNIADVSPW
jgi:hypothetical protein